MIWDYHQAKGAAMTVSGFLAVLRRRWLVVALVLMCTVVALALVHKRPIDYQACASVALITPKTSDFPNVYDNTQASLVATTGLVTEKVMSPATQRQLAAQGMTASYDAEVLNTGTDASPTFTEPLTTVCSTSYNAAVAGNTTDAVVASFGEILRTVQADAKVSPRDFITAKVIVPSTPLAILGRPSQALLGVGLIGLTLAISLAMWTDTFMRRRSQRFQVLLAQAAPRLGRVSRPRWDETAQDSEDGLSDFRHSM
jgi:hypothetical protein